jgi:hypothetical protein
MDDLDTANAAEKPRTGNQTGSDALRTNAAPPHGAPLEELAEQSGCSIDVVEDIYSEEFVRLQRDARIRSYIPVLAMKRVRDALRHER